MQKIFMPLVLVFLLIGCKSKYDLSEVENYNGIYLYKGTRVNGTICGNDPSQTLNLQFQVKNGIMDGLSEGYYNGKLISTANYKEGGIVGIQTIYYKDGKLQEKNNYKNGKRDGLSESYYENGKLKEKNNYVDGERDGLVEYYYDNGKLKRKLNYVKGRLNGLDESYYEEGKINGRQKWEDNSVSSYEYYDKNGNIKQSGQN